MRYTTLTLRRWLDAATVAKRCKPLETTVYGIVRKVYRILL